MQKTQIDIPVLLPDIPDERDECVERLIGMLSDRKGVDRVHLRKNGHISQLCIHFDPTVVSLERIKELAHVSGAGLTERYRHITLETRSVTHARRARQIERELGGLAGVVEARVSPSGIIFIELDTERTDATTVKEELRRMKLWVSAPSGGAERTGAERDRGAMFGERTELAFSIICGVLLLMGFIFSLSGAIPGAVVLGFYIGAYIFGGFFTAKEAFEKLSRGVFEIDFLMLVAAVGAAILGEWAEGAFLLFLFSMGHALEQYAMGRARRSIAALADLAARHAHVRREGQIVEVEVEDLLIGDIVIVKPNSKIPVDGMVIKGESSVNQAPITGESIPVDKKAAAGSAWEAVIFSKLPDEQKVFSGTINGNNTLEVRVLKEARDSTLVRLIELVQEAEAQKSPTQRFADRFERYYVPAVLLLVLILNFTFLVLDEPFERSFYRAMAVLVAASPCALAISTPSAVLSGIARAARGGVLVKGGRPLEDLGELRAMAFDKTGTLTRGMPELTGCYAVDGDEEELLSAALAVERLSDHPLAQAITVGAKKRLGPVEVPEATDLEAVAGRGVRATWQGEVVVIGNRDFFKENGGIPGKVNDRVMEFESQGSTTMLVQRGRRILGILTVRDEPRPEAKEVLSRLKTIGIRRMVMISGDDQRVAEAIGKEVGMTDAFGNLLPEEKVETVKKLREAEKRVAMVGDGVNDAPAMAHSTVGIAMGAAGSDVALETADIALMADSLLNLPFAIGLSRKTRRIITQNLWISLGMIVVLVPLTITGIASMGPAVLFHEGSTIVVVMNALRLLGYKEEYP